MKTPSAFPRRLTSLAFVAASAGFLYLGGPSGKEALAEEACGASARIADSVKDLARGDVGAMNISKKPEALPDFAFNGPDGKATSLSAFRGKTLLFNVWATWCVPCRAEMPELDKLQADLGSDRFQVVTVNIDTSRLERPKKFFEETGVKSLDLNADPKANIFFELKQAGKALGLPVTILIGPDGCQIGLMNGPAAWHSADAKALVSKAVEAASR
ncbi:TlpA family protein disulfide reductase [Methylocystis sp. WRRC1]|uniref:thiol:disulfide interchange protein TlpA n=1 Tax=Methylocystis sp. WRRC1 TaxID=1732014 RepID=UPI001D14AFBD|nr:TlpA disulfide reductase family protein [Methylocystis sp. WRRC1]MCC3245644.1 TlpA family protein disulfide reductase [Methylocystis sp. WRRC1]